MKKINKTITQKQILKLAKESDYFIIWYRYGNKLTIDNSLLAFGETDLTYSENGSTKIIDYFDILEIETLVNKARLKVLPKKESKKKLKKNKLLKG